MNIPMKLIINLLLLVFVTIFGQMGILPQVSIQLGDYWKQPHSMLTQVDTDVRTENSFLYYGELTIELPQGMNFIGQKSGEAISQDRRQTEDRNAWTVIDLTQGRAGRLAPRIWIKHYTMGNYNEWAMTGVLLDLLSDTTLCFCYRNNEEDINCFTYTRGCINGFVLSRGDDIYLVEEVCGEAVFGKLLTCQFVSWSDGSLAYEEGQSRAAWFDRLVIGEEFFQAVRYTAEDGMRWLILMQDGKYGQIYQKIAIGDTDPVLSEQLICKDYNFDGYTDIQISSKVLYLWNPDKKFYEETPVSGEFLQLQEVVFFPDTKVIWGYQSGTDVAQWSNRSEAGILWKCEVETEILWQWEGKDLIKKRSCRAEIFEESVQLHAYDAMGSLGAEFDEIVTLEAYQKGSGGVRALYERFYDKMVPAETYARAHDIEYDREHIQYISQELLAVTADVMSHEAERYEIVPQGNGGWLSEEAVLDIAEDNADLRDAVARTVDIDYTMLMADGDNDGIMDIIAQEESFKDIKDYVFYQGQSDGTYVKTDVFTCAQSEFMVITYEGKNYLRCTDYDRVQCRYENVSIIYFVDGKCVEQAAFELVPEEYGIAPAQYTQEKYSPYAAQLIEDALGYKAAFDEDGVIVGRCEEKLSEYEKYPYQCDLNNDGVAEQYTKNLYHMSSENSDVYYIRFDGQGDGVGVTNDAFYAMAAVPAMIWAEEYEGRNIVNMMFCTGLEDFEIVCFLLTGLEYEKICGVSAAADYSVNVSGRRADAAAAQSGCSGR